MKSVFWTLIGATASLSSGIHPQSNGQTERKKQEMELPLRCLVPEHPASLSKLLLRVNYAHNTLTRVSTSTVFGPGEEGVLPLGPG